MPSHWNELPPELVEMIVDNIIVDISDSNLRALQAFIRTCRLFRAVGLQKLYKGVALRHPYMLVWAAETNNLPIMSHLLDAGLDPDTVFWPPSIIGVYWLPWGERCCQVYGPRYDNPARNVPHRQEMHTPAYIFRNFYMIPDRTLMRHMEDEETATPDPMFKTWCDEAAKDGGQPYLAFATLKGSYPEPIRKGSTSKPWVINGSCPTWKKLQGQGKNTLYISALHSAAANGHVDAMKLLLEHGATIDIAAPTQCSCKHLNFHRHGYPHFEMLPEDPEELERYNRDRWRDRSGRGYLWTALHLAICQGQLESVRFLISHGARHLSEVRTQLPWQTVLHHAASISPATTGIVADLLTVPEFHGYLTTGNKQGLTPLWTAYLAGRDDNMALLTTSGADINDCVRATRPVSRPRINANVLPPAPTPRLPPNGFTMLYHACASGRLDMVTVLLGLGASTTPTFRGEAGDIDHRILNTNGGNDGPFPMRALDILVASLCRSHSVSDQQDMARRATAVINALITASGGLAPAPPVGAGEVPVAQDPLLIATSGCNIPLLKVLLRHPSFGAYMDEADEEEVYEAGRRANATWIRVERAKGNLVSSLSTAGSQSTRKVWKKAIRGTNGMTWVEFS